MERGKTYTKKGFIVVEKEYAILFNEKPFSGYNWYTSDNIYYVGIKGTKKDFSINKSLNLNYIWRLICRKK